MNYKLPTRFDNEYTKIDKFEKHEYTHGITYELARRNTYVSDTLNLLYELFLYYEQRIRPYLQKCKKVAIIDNNSKVINDIENMFKSFLIGLVVNYKKKQFSNHFEGLTCENIIEKISYFVKTLVKELHDEYYIIYQHEAEKFTSDFNEIYDPLLERDKVLTEHIINIESDKDQCTYSYLYNDFFTICQGVKKNQKDFSLNIIYPSFTNPMRDFADTKIALNLNLPKDEIIDYIEKIKNDYDNKNSIIKTPWQLLGEELEIYDNVVDSIYTEEWSDILFIYDYYNTCKLLTNKKNYEIICEIQIELIKYHGVKIKKTQDEIKNKKDNIYKLVPWKEYCKNNPDTNEENILSDKDAKAYLSGKAIENKNKLIKEFIEGKNPKYKTLINRATL